MKRSYAIILPAAVASLAIVALAMTPSGATAKGQGVSFPEIQPVSGTFSLFLNDSKDQRDGAKLVFEAGNGQITVTNFVTQSAITGTDVTERFAYSLDGHYIKMPLSGLTFDGWYGQNGEPVSPQSGSRVTTTIEGVKLVARNGQVVITLPAGSAVDLSEYGINDQLDWLLFPVQMVEISPTETPKPTETPTPVTPVPTAFQPPTAVPTATPMPDYEIKGLVWQDTNHDGKFQGSEPIMSGLTMTLYTKVGESFTAVDTMTLQPVFSPGDVRNYYFHQTVAGRMKLGVNIPAEIFGLPCYASAGLDAGGFSQEFEIKPDENNRFVVTKNLAIVCERRTFLPVMVVS